MKPASIFKEIDYVCLCDRDLKKEEQTVFVVGSLTVEQEAYLDDIAEGEAGTVKYGTIILETLHMGLKKVKNFKDGNKSIKFERDEKGPVMPGDVHPWKTECMQRIALKERREICTFIRGLSALSEEELKNLRS